MKLCCPLTSVCLLSLFTHGNKERIAEGLSLLIRMSSPKTTDCSFKEAARPSSHSEMTLLVIREKRVCDSCAKKQKTAMLRFYCRRTWHSAGGLHMRNHAKKESLAHTEVNYAHILYPPRRWNARKTKTQTKWHNPYWSEITNPPTTSQDAPGKSQSIPPKPHLAPSWPQTDSHGKVWPPCFVTTSCRWGSL